MKYNPIRTNFFLIAILSCLLINSYGQTEGKYYYSKDGSAKWIIEMYKANPDYGKLIDLYNDYYKTNKFEKNNHTQYYKRLLHDLSQSAYGLEFGLNSPKDVEKMQSEYNKRIEMNKTLESPWQCVGPFDFDKEAASRSYAPGAAHMYTVEQSVSNTDYVYAGGATCGLWKSTDKGLNWSFLSMSNDFNKVYSLEIDFTDENTVYFGAGSEMYKTTDGGLTINLIGDPAFKSASHGTFREIIMNPDSNNIIWAASDAGLYFTKDAGNNWVQSMSGKFQEIEFHPNNSNIIYAVRQVSDSSEFYRSDNGGISFVKKTSGWPSPSTEGQPAENKRVELAVTTTAPDYVYAYATGVANGGSGTYGVYVSYDLGENWNFQCCGNQVAGPPDPITNPNLMGWSSTGSDNGGQYYYDVAFAVSPTNSDSVFVGGVNMWYSADGGSNFTCPAAWSSPQEAGYIHADIHDVKIYGSDIWVACDGGIFYSNDGGQNVNKRMLGISGSDFWGFGSGYTNSNVMIGGTYHNGTQLKDNDVYTNGWACIQGGDNWRGQVNPFDDRIVYDDGGRKQLSGDRTVSITKLSYGIKPNKISNLEFSENYQNIIYSGIGNSLYKSDNFGISGSEIYNFGAEVGRVKVAPSNSNVIVVATNDGGIYDQKYLYRSTDGGQTWIDITPNSTVLNGNTNIPYDFEINETKPDIIYLARIPRYGWNAWLKDGYKVFKTTDGGQTWINITSASLNGEWITNIAYQKGSNENLYLGTRRSVYYKDATSSSWSIFGNMLPKTTYSTQLDIDYRKGQIINATNHSVYVNSLIENNTEYINFVATQDTFYCVRDTVYYYDYSSADTSFSRSWSFSGASYISSSTSLNPKVIYADTGSYDLTLSIDAKSATKYSFIHILPECNPETIAGNAMQTISPGDYCNLPDINLNTNTVSLTAWVKPNGIQSDYSGIIFNDDPSAGLNFREGNNTLGYHWPNGAWWWDSQLVAPADVWSHVAMVVSPTSIKIYLNGEVATHSFNTDSVNFGTLKIGTYKGWSSRNFKGLIDEVCIYDTCISQDAIRGLMYKTKNPLELNHLIHYYQFNRNSGMVTDRVGIGHGEFTGGANRLASTAPIPYVSISDGNWENNGIWADGQNAPVKSWSRVKIKHADTLNIDFQLIELRIDSNATLIIKPSVNLNVSGK